ncbi:hypothetical protein [Natrinema versiforme]|uniref:Uncharacterized protein n=1 Tax=Natrinema versiforme JCM 10478 TaxID=1227496 RepID=L9YB40_9EURY|nr:hypothetical protein [Natrinema versiforme]ELY70932.1 hypothetical protein C489_01201 [Natrinema versiforme JCM 10478]
MLDDLLLLPFEAAIDWVVGRNEDRTVIQQLCLFCSIVFALLAVALAVTSGPLYGLAAGVIAVALLYYGV